MISLTVIMTREIEYTRTVIARLFHRKRKQRQIESKFSTMIETDSFVSIAIMNGRVVECVMPGHPSFRFRQKSNYNSKKCKSPGRCFSYAVENRIP